MLYGMYLSAAGALANIYRQDVEANNMANVDTVAFKRDLALLQARSAEPEGPGSRIGATALLKNMGGGTFALPTYTDFSPSSLKQTGSAFDLALSGPGFFQLQHGKDVYFTRDGRVRLDEHNQLVSVATSLPILDDSGNAISIDPAYPLVVNDAGVISQNGAEVAKLGIVQFDDNRVLQKQGNNVYKLKSKVTPKPSNSLVKQGYLENSGVKATDTITKMIKTQRMIQANLNMLKVQDQTLGLAVTRLGNIT